MTKPEPTAPRVSANVDAVKQRARPCRADDTLVPVINHGVPVEMTADPALSEGPPAVLVIPSGVSYHQRAVLFAAGTLFDMMHAEPRYDEWRCFERCAEVKSGRVEIADPVAQRAPKAMALIGASTDPAGLIQWAKTESRAAIAHALQARIRLLAALATAKRKS